MLSIYDKVAGYRLRPEKNKNFFADNSERVKSKDQSALYTGAGNGCPQNE